MANQEQSRDGIPRKDGDRPSPDVEQYSTDGQSNARGKGASDEQGSPGPAAGEKRPTLTLPKGEEKGVARESNGSGQDYQGDGPGKDAKGGDSAPLGPPGAGLSDRNGPSDPDNRKQ